MLLRKEVGGEKTLHLVSRAARANLKQRKDTLNVQYYSSNNIAVAIGNRKLRGAWQPG